MTFPWSLTMVFDPWFPPRFPHIVSRFFAMFFPCFFRSTFWGLGALHRTTPHDFCQQPIRPMALYDVVENRRNLAAVPMANSASEDENLGEIRGKSGLLSLWDSYLKKTNGIYIYIYILYVYAYIYIYQQ